MSQNNPTQLFGFLIHEIARLLSRTFEQQTSELKVTREQARVLAYIAVNEGAKQADIARLMDVQKIRITKLVDDLEQRALIERRSDPGDRRVKRLYIAQGAQEVLDGIWQRLSEVSDIALASIPPEGRVALIAQLGVIRDTLVENNS
jgi:MarR family transcriptional regulator for hemolysin